MTRPDQPDHESPIADTAMFRRFVDEAPAVDHPVPASRTPWVWAGVAVSIVIVALIIWLLVK